MALYHRMQKQQGTLGASDRTTFDRGLMSEFAEEGDEIRHFSPTLPQPIPLHSALPWGDHRGRAPFPQAQDRSAAVVQQALSPTSPQPRFPPRNGRQGSSTPPRPSGHTVDAPRSGQSRAAALIPSKHIASTPPQLRVTPSRGRYVPPSGSPRVHTGLVSEQRSPHVSARERVLIEEEEQRSKRRSLSPAFRSTSSRFGPSRAFGGDPEQYDRLSYLKPSLTSRQDFYVPPGLAELSVRATSPAKVVMRSTTPRFQRCIPHGTGMLCPVLDGSAPSPHH